ncbi:MAG: type VI secretion system lipoprotein TssJ [Planctomycetota bacterium]
MKSGRRVWHCTALWLCVLGSSCSSFRSPVDPGPVPVEEIHYRTSPNLAPDSRGNPCDVRIKIYQLRDASKFLECSLGAKGKKELWEEAEETLGADLLGEAQFHALEPNRPADQTLFNSIPIRHRRDGTRYVGVVADYRKAEKKRFRAIIEASRAASHVFVFDRFKVSPEKRPTP